MITHDPDISPAIRRPEAEVSEAFTERTAAILHQVDQWLHADEDPGTRLPAPIFYPEMTSATSEAEAKELYTLSAFDTEAEDRRDYFVEQLGLHLGMDVDQALTASEKDWAAAGNQRVAVLPWMKRRFMMANPEKGFQASGTLREARVSAEGQRELWLHEIEFPVHLIGDDGEPSIAMRRCIYFSPFSRREYEAQPSDSRLQNAVQLASYLDVFIESGGERIERQAVHDDEAQAEELDEDDKTVPPAMVDLDAGSESGQVVFDHLLHELAGVIDRDATPDMQPGPEGSMPTTYEQLITGLRSYTSLPTQLEQMPLWFREQTVSVFGDPEQSAELAVPIIRSEVVLDVRGGIVYLLRTMEVHIRPSDTFFPALPPRIVRAVYFDSEPVRGPSSGELTITVSKDSTAK